MGRGYFLVRGDITTCGGRIIEGADDHTIMGIPQARDMDRVTCGRYPGMFIIVGGVPQTDIHGRLMAGTLDSKSSCPCQSRFIASMMNDVYEVDGGNTDAGNEQENESENKYKFKVLLIDYENEYPISGIDIEVNGYGTSQTDINGFTSLFDPVNSRDLKISVKG